MVQTAQPATPDAKDVSAIRPPEELWREVIRERGDVVASCDCGSGLGSLTFAQLDAQSDILATRVREALASPVIDGDSPVASLLTHDLRSAVNAIAILKVGRADLTLDPAVPLERLATIVRASGAQLIITVPEHRDLAEQLGAVAVVSLDGLDDPLKAPAAPLDWATPGLDDIAGITYTSGSTGVPKGVAVRHRTSGHHVAHRLEYDWLRSGDAVGMVMPLSFGAARGDLNAALLAGATVHFFNPREQGPGPLPGWLVRERITVLSGPPSLLTATVRTLAPDQMLSDSLRMVRSAGEKVLCSEAVAIRRVLTPECRLINAFGSSEATLVSCYEITDATPDIPRPVPAGWPLPGFEVRFEREDGTAPDPGEVGELIVTSRHLPAGYWRDEERTRQKYTPLPGGRTSLATGDLAVALPDGSFRLAGRKDLSVKIRGNLVEPAEVEGALLHCKGVAEAVVVGRATPSGRERLIGYLVLHRDAEIVRTAELRRELRRTLPSYMLPESVVFLPELPRNDRGKVDRQALPDPPARIAADVVPPRTPWEKQVAAIWAEVLQLDEVGAEDDFFDLGGDSLSAEELVARLSEAHHVEVSSRLLLEAPSLAEFAVAVIAKRAQGSDRLVGVQRTGMLQPLYCMSGAGRLGMTYLPLAKRLGADQPLWGLQDGKREELRFPEMSVKTIARRNIAAMRAVHPGGPFLLAGHSLGGVVAFEMAHQLRAAGDQVALLVAFDSFPPHPKGHPPLRRRPLSEWMLAARRYGAIASGRALKGRPLTAQSERPVSGFYTRQARLVSLFYRGRPYAGRTLIVVAADEASRLGADVYRGHAWKPYLRGQWRIESTPGTHKTMLNEPHVAALADLLTQEIQEALPSSD